MHQYVRVGDTIEVSRFIHDLKVVLKRAVQSGGGHSAFLHNDEDEVILQIEIAPLVRPKK